MPHTWGEDVEKLTQQRTNDNNGEEECKADLLAHVIAVLFPSPWDSTGNFGTIRLVCSSNAPRAPK